MTIFSSADLPKPEAVDFVFDHMNEEFKKLAKEGKPFCVLQGVPHETIKLISIILHRAAQEEKFKQPVPGVLMSEVIKSVRKMADDMEGQLKSGVLGPALTFEIPPQSVQVSYDWKNRIALKVEVARPANESEAGEYVGRSAV